MTDLEWLESLIEKAETDDQMDISMGKGLVVVLNRSQVFPDDPGQGTPALVFDADTGASSTYTVATCEGELEGEDGMVELTERQLEWLESIWNEIEQFLYD